MTADLAKLSRTGGIHARRSPPHEKIHGIGDFLLHLFTITVGLLIALGLEGCVERMHQRHLRQEADTTLRQEIQENQKELASGRSKIDEEEKHLTVLLPLLQARAEGRAYNLHEVTLDYTMGTLRDAGWRTASATGALSLMEYRQVAKFAAAYQIQDQFTALQSQTLSEFLRLQSYVVAGVDPDKMSPLDAQGASQSLRLLLVHLGAMGQIGDGLDRSYREALSEK